MTAEPDIANSVSALRDAMKQQGLDIDESEMSKVVKKALAKKAREAPPAPAEPEGIKIATERDSTSELAERLSPADPEFTHVIIGDEPKARIIRPEKVKSEFPGLPSGNGKFRKPKFVEPQVEYKATTFAVDLHARPLLPQDDSVNFIDPLAGVIPIKGLQREKTILEAMSRTLKKPLPPLGYIFIIGIIVILGVVIGYDAVIKDYIEASQDYQIRRELNNLTAGEQPPRLFDFRNLPIPGVRSNED